MGAISDPNYTGSATNTLEIAQATGTIALSGLNQPYDGMVKRATATPIPAGLVVSLTYNGSKYSPTNAGSYVVVGTISDPNYTGSTTNALVIAPAAATVTLGNLGQSYDGTGKPASAVTIPGGLAVSLTYNGSSALPTNAGTYTVIGVISDVNYSGAATNTLAISPATATVALGNLSQTYCGTAKCASASTIPSGLTVVFTYNGSSVPPINPGNYTVVGTICDTNYVGSATSTLTIKRAGPAVIQIRPRGDLRRVLPNR